MNAPRPSGELARPNCMAPGVFSEILSHFSCINHLPLSHRLVRVFVSALPSKTNTHVPGDGNQGSFENYFCRSGLLDFGSSQGNFCFILFSSPKRCQRHDGNPTGRRRSNLS